MNTWFHQYLACPDCRADLYLKDEEVRCHNCGYQITRNGAFNLKPINPSRADLCLPRILSNPPSESLSEIEIRRPIVTYEGPSALRDSREFMSLITNYLETGASVLDAGCGPRDQAIPIEHLGHKYVGIDYANQAADVLADAHALPFKANTFDCVISYAVFQYMHNPFIAIQEIERVLRPRGILIGSVAQGEPFNVSFFQYTAWGLISLVEAATDMEIKRLWPTYDTLKALSRMGRYPKIIKALLGAVNFIDNKAPFLAPRSLNRSLKVKRLDELFRTGSICFLIQKP